MDEGAQREGILPIHAEHILFRILSPASVVAEQKNASCMESIHNM